MEIIEKLQEKISSFEEMKNKLIVNLREDISLAFKEILKEAQTFETISWTQYTNYFNDGEECTFSAYTDNLYIDGEGEPESLKERIWSNGYKTNPDYNVHDGEIVNNFKNLLKSVPEDFLKEIFGNHVQVTVKKDGTITIDTYNDHD